MHENQMDVENDLLTRKKSKLGIRLFFLYFILYAGFVVIGVFEYELLALEVFSGLNLALSYGIGLIVFAIILGIVYDIFCSRYERDFSK